MMDLPDDIFEKDKDEGQGKGHVSGMVPIGAPLLCLVSLELMSPDSSVPTRPLHGRTIAAAPVCLSPELHLCSLAPRIP